jgi:hypothetical protein
MLVTNAGGGMSGDIAAEMHRTTFRGKNLGSAVTAAQRAAIVDGTFKDLFVGDYWVINGVTWRIVDINYWLNCGDTAFTANHLVIMPDNSLYNSQMNTTNITTGGYISSAMRTNNLTNAKATIGVAFPSGLVKTKRQLFENAITNGKPSAGAWVNSDVDLPNEINAYGSNIFRPANDGITIPYNYTIDKQQFALFAICPKFIMGWPRHSYWLRDPVSASHFAHVYYLGNASYAGASTSFGVRPCFAIG